MACRSCLCNFSGVLFPPIVLALLHPKPIWSGYSMGFLLVLSAPPGGDGCKHDPCDPHFIIIYGLPEQSFYCWFLTRLFHQTVWVLRGKKKRWNSIINPASMIYSVIKLMSPPAQYSERNKHMNASCLVSNSLAVKIITLFFLAIPFLGYSK